MLHRSEIVQIEDWCDEIVMRFAVQALIAPLGIDMVRAWAIAQTRTKQQGRNEKKGNEEDNEEIEGMQLCGEGEKEAEKWGPHQGGVQRSEFASLAAAVEQYDADEKVRAVFAPLIPSTTPAAASDGDEENGSSSCSDVNNTNSNSSNSSNVSAEKEAYTKRAIQLLSQLCLVETPLLRAFSELYSAWVSSQTAQNQLTEKDGSFTMIVEGGGEDTAMAVADSGAAETPIAASSTLTVAGGDEGTEANIVAPVSGENQLFVFHWCGFIECIWA